MTTVAHDDLTGSRTAHRIVRPATAGGHPHHMRAVVGRRRHQYVVAIGDHHRRRMPGQPAAQRPLDVVDLADAVELIARQVQQHDHRGFDGVGHMWHVHLVDLQRGQPGVARSRQRGNQSGVHVRALGVRGDGSECAQRRRGHPGGGRLAVGACDNHGATALAQLAKHRLVQRQSHQPADHRAGTTPGDSRCPSRAGPGRECDTSTSGDHPRQSKRVEAGSRHAGQRSGGMTGVVGDPCHPRSVSQTWGRPANDTGAGWAVVDVETSGFRPGQARIVSVAALALGDDGNVEQSLYTLLNPGVDPGPTHVHGLTTEMLQGQPCFGDVVGNLIDLLKGRTLVAHNVGFDYSFLAAEAELVGAELPIDTVMCTVELTRRLELGTENLRLETLAAHWGITQMKPHDALDDAMVLAQILKPVLVRARERKAWLPVRSVTRRCWPNGQVTHEELRPLKMLAARLPCPYLNPGRFVAGRPLVQGMRVGLSAEVRRTHEELIERIVHAGLAYTDAVDPETSLVICNEPEPEHGKGYQANELGVPLVNDTDFMQFLDAVVGGTGIEEFADTRLAGEQFALF